jgi:hypothetical protein
VAQQLRVEEGFPLLMLSRITYGPGQEPLVFSQDFLRGDYARIHADAQLEARAASGVRSAFGKEVTPDHS